MADIIVSLAGNNANNGTSVANAVRTITRGYQLARAGDRVLVKKLAVGEAVYGPEGTSGITVKSGVTLQFEDNVVLDQQNSVTYGFLNASGGSEDFKLLHVRVRNCPGAGITLRAKRFEIGYCDIRNVGGNGISLNGWTGWGCDGGWIHDNYLENCQESENYRSAISIVNPIAFDDVPLLTQEPGIPGRPGGGWGFIIADNVVVFTGYVGRSNGDGNAIILDLFANLNGARTGVVTNYTKHTLVTRNLCLFSSGCGIKCTNSRYIHLFRNTAYGNKRSTYLNTNNGQTAANVWLGEYANYHGSGHNEWRENIGFSIREFGGTMLMSKFNGLSGESASYTDAGYVWDRNLFHNTGSSRVAHRVGGSPSPILPVEKASPGIGGYFTGNPKFVGPLTEPADEARPALGAGVARYRARFALASDSPAKGKGQDGGDLGAIQSTTPPVDPGITFDDPPVMTILGDPIDVSDPDLPVYPVGATVQWSAATFLNGPPDSLVQTLEWWNGSTYVTTAAVATGPSGGVYSSKVPTSPVTKKGGLRVKVAATKGSVTVVATSNWINVAPAPVLVETVPVNLVLPAISPSAPKVGIAASVSTGTWSGEPAPTFVVQWKVAGVNGTGTGATTNTYTPAASDLGKALTCVVTATNTAGSASATSAATSAVTAALTLPANTSAPAITPTTPTVGIAATVSTGTWTGNPSPVFSYQWKAAGVNGTGTGATTSSYVPAASDLGKALTCVVTATNSQGSTSATTAGTSPVAGSTADMTLAEATAAILTLQSLVATLQTNDASQTTRQSDTEATLTTATAEVGALKSQVATLRANTDATTARNAQQDTAIEGIQTAYGARLGDLEADTGGLRDKVVALESGLDSLERESSAASDVVALLDNRVSDNEAATRALSAQVAALAAGGGGGSGGTATPSRASAVPLGAGALPGPIESDAVVVFSYPAGRTQAEFIGALAAVAGQVVINGNDVYNEAEGEVSFSYLADTVEVTNLTGMTWPTGSRILAVGANAVAAGGGSSGSSGSGPAAVTASQVVAMMAAAAADATLGPQMGAAALASQATLSTEARLDAIMALFSGTTATQEDVLTGTSQKIPTAAAVGGFFVPRDVPYAATLSIDFSGSTPAWGAETVVTGVSAACALQAATFPAWAKNKEFTVRFVRASGTGNVTLQDNGVDTMVEYIDGLDASDVPALGTNAGDWIEICGKVSSATVWHVVSVRAGHDTLRISGGTITTPEGYEVATFSSLDAIAVTGSGVLHYEVVAAGAAAGDPSTGTGGARGAGGGAGEIKRGSVFVTEGVYPVVVGAAGAFVTASQGADGGNSSVFGITALGGGGGGGGNSFALSAGRPGGSGGGGAGYSGATTASGGATTAADGGLGNAGGAGSVSATAGDRRGGGGGGAGGAGAAATAAGSTGIGGAGSASTCPGVSATYAIGGNGYLGVTPTAPTAPGSGGHAGATVGAGTSGVGGVVHVWVAA